MQGGYCSSSPSSMLGEDTSCWATKPLLKILVNLALVRKSTPASSTIPGTVRAACQSPHLRTNTRSIDLNTVGTRTNTHRRGDERLPACSPRVANCGDPPSFRPTSGYTSCRVGSGLRPGVRWSSHTTSSPPSVLLAGPHETPRDGEHSLWDPWNVIALVRKATSPVSW